MDETLDRKAEVISAPAGEAITCSIVRRGEKEATPRFKMVQDVAKRVKYRTKKATASILLTSANGQTSVTSSHETHDR